MFARPFPDTFAKVVLTGSGTAQTGVVAAGVNPSATEVFYAAVSTTNSGPLTLSIGGGPVRPVVNIAGNPLSAGEWTGMVMFYLNDAGQYQLLLDAGAAAAAAQSASEAHQSAADAEVAHQGAEAAAERAEDFAAFAGTASGRFSFKTVASLLADTTMGYAGSGAAVIVGEGDIVEAQGFRYMVAASGAVDAAGKTVGNVKFYTSFNNSGHVINNVAAAASLAIYPAPSSITTLGYYEPGDGGGATYKRVNSEPSHAGKISVTLPVLGTIFWYSLQEQVGVNILQFGAKSRDPSFDSAPAIQAALTAFRVVNIPDGQFRLGGPVVMTDSNVLRGQGAPRSLLQVVNAVGGIDMSGRNTTVEGVHISCEFSGQTAVGITRRNQQQTIRDVYVWNGTYKFLHGVQVPSGAQPWSSTHTNLRIRGSYGHHYVVNSPSGAFNANYFYGCHFIDSETGAGFICSANYSHGTAFFGCLAEQNANDGFTVASIIAGKFSFVGCYTEMNGGVGIYLGKAGSANFTQSASIIGHTSYQDRIAAVYANYINYVDIIDMSVGADDPGYYTQGALAGGRGDGAADARMFISGLSRKGAASDFAMVTNSRARKAVLTPYNTAQTEVSVTYNPPSSNAGSGAVTTVTVPGAVLGGIVDVSFSLDVQGLILSGYVSAPDTVSVRIQNGTAGAIDLGSGTLRVRVS
jgi:hypothetical protein